MIARRARAPAQGRAVGTRRGRQGHVAAALADSLAGHRRNTRHRIHRHGHRGRVCTVVGIRTRNRVGRGIGSRGHRDGGARLVVAPCVGAGAIGRQGRASARTDCIVSGCGRHVRQRIDGHSNRHTGRLTTCSGTHRSVVGRAGRRSSHIALASAHLAGGSVVGIPIDGALIGRGTHRHLAGAATRDRSVGQRGDSRCSRLRHRHRIGSGAAVFGTRHRVGSAGRNGDSGVGAEVIGPLVGRVHQRRGGSQGGGSALTDGSRCDRRVVDAYIHIWGRVDRQMVGGRSGTTVVVGARHRIVTGCGRGDRRVASHIVGPHVVGGTGGRQGDGIGATSGGGTGDAHRGGVVGRHGHRGGVATALRRSTSHCVSTSGAHINRSGRCIVRPHIGGSPSRCQGRISSGAHSSATRDGHSGKGINHNRYRTRVGTSVRSGTCHSIGGLCRR